MPSAFRSIRRWLDAPADGAGLAALRIALGFILTVSALRFLYRGWVDEIYLAPRFHFTYVGFEWVRPWPEPFMTLHVVALAALGALLSVGLFTRFAAVGYFVLFSYAELIEKAAYLNHYYLVSLLVLLLAFVPANRCWSLDARLGWVAKTPLKHAHYALFRAQLTIVYLYAGLAKLNPDWLFRAEPIHTWLRAHAELPFVGPWLGEPSIALGMSYFGVLFDLTIPFALSYPRSRPFAAGLALVFHLAISFLFPVGIFSYVMLAGLTVFLPPDWPRHSKARLLGRDAPALLPAPVEVSARGPRPSQSRVSSVLFALGCAHLAFQALFPLRFLLYPGHVNWTEQGFRFSWRVMLIEKAGHAEFHVRRPKTGEEYLVLPRKELTVQQLKQMATEADMIHEYALHLGDRFRRSPAEPIEVRVDSFVAWNGRPSQRFIDPNVDLAAIPRSLRPLPFILPAPP
jgi:vitamin K-dependent gamma-carboxylase